MWSNEAQKIRRIRLDDFTPRIYQIPFIRAFKLENKRKCLIAWPRRSGKDYCAFRIMLEEALLKPQLYWYIFPTYRWGKRVAWKSKTGHGKPLISLIPDELIKSKNASDLSIELINGSVIEIIGSNTMTADDLRGANPYGIIFSEHAYGSPYSLSVLSSVINENGGWIFIISTVFGENHFWDLYQRTRYLDYWFSELLTLDDTKHISKEKIEANIKEGIISSDMVEQEYYNNPHLGVAGSFYARALNDLYLKGQIGDVPWDPSYMVHTAWDIGYDNDTAITFFQIVGSSIHIIDYFADNKHGVSHYANTVLEKPYTYGTHLGPHDLKKHESEGRTIKDNYARLGINFTVVPDVGKLNGIEEVRIKIPRMYINDTTCKDLIKCLKNYRRKWDEQKRKYHSEPLHDWASDAADSVRYLCVGVELNLVSGRGMTQKDVITMRNKAYYGRQQLEGIFK